MSTGQLSEGQIDHYDAQLQSIRTQINQCADEIESRKPGPVCASFRHYLAATRRLRAAGNEMIAALAALDGIRFEQGSEKRS